MTEIGYNTDDELRLPIPQKPLDLDIRAFTIRFALPSWATNLSK